MTYVLYDSKTNKKINLKKINLEHKNKIINGEYYVKNLTKDFQKELSYDEEYLPLFDIIIGVQHSKSVKLVKLLLT